MTKPEFFGRQLFGLHARHRNSGGHGRANELQFGDPNLDLSRDHLVIPCGVRPEGHLPTYKDDRFRSERRRGCQHLRGGPFGIEGQLDDPGPVPKVDEYHPSEVSPAVDPPTETDLLPHQLAGQAACIVCTKGGLSHPKSLWNEQLQFWR